MDDAPGIQRAGLGRLQHLKKHGLAEATPTHPGARMGEHGGPVGGARARSMDRDRRRARLPMRL